MTERAVHLVDENKDTKIFIPFAQIQHVELKSATMFITMRNGETHYTIFQDRSEAEKQYNNVKNAFELYLADRGW